MSPIERCNCIMAAHCSPTKAGCRLKAGGTVNAGGGVCGPKDEEKYVPASQLRGAVDTALRDVLEEAKRRTPQLTGDQLTGDRIAMTIGYVVIDRLRGQ